MKNVRSSQASISLDSCTGFSKTQFFPVNIVVQSLVFSLFTVGFKKLIHKQKVKETVFN